MFGYVRYDLPNLFIKDFMLYKALYCGLCKGIAKSCGQRARIGLTYDVTFLSALLHNIAGVDVKIDMENCFEHTLKKRPIAAVDELTEELGALNTLLAYYKLTDDIEDGGKGRGRRLWFKKGKKRAEKRFPRIAELVRTYMAEQSEAERARTDSPDMAAEPTACMLRALSDHLLGDKATPCTAQLFYDLGKWVYLIDALDDYDKDAAKKRYNPFVLRYGRESREQLMARDGGDVRFLFDTLFYSLRESLSGISFPFNRDLTDNVILRGIPIETELVMQGRHLKKMQENIRVE